MTFDWPQMRAAVRALDVDVDDIALAGSAPLLAHGIISSAGDVDLVARGRAWTDLAARGEPHEGLHGDLVVDLPGGIQVFPGWHGEPADAIVERAGCVDGIPVMALSAAIATKERRGRARDREHLAAVDSWVDDMTATVAADRPAVTRFRDRAHAGELLAPRVAALRPVDPVVVALPRGGVPVAAPVARDLGCELDVLVVRKLGLPTNPEYAFGAIGEGGEPLIDERIVAAADLLPDEVASVVAAERREVDRRLALYRAARGPLTLEGRTAVIVDDGAATGSTALAAIGVARGLGCASVIVAVGTAPPDVLALIQRHADHAAAAMTPEPFISVGQWYDDFAPTTDDEVLSLLQRTN